MRTKILAIVFAAALALGMAVPALAGGPPTFVGNVPDSLPTVPTDSADAQVIACDHAVPEESSSLPC